MLILVVAVRQLCVRVAGRLITRVDEACLFLFLVFFLIFLFCANARLAFSSFSSLYRFFLRPFLFFVYKCGRGCLPQKAREKESEGKKRSTNGNEENSCVNKIDR